MGIGLKIKEYRTKAGLTQKDLADELHVTYQAVSRWENDDAEPSFDMLKDMCKILNCSTDDLFDIKKPEVEENKEQSPQIIERVIIKESEQKPVLGVCEGCNKPIYEASDLFRVEESISVRSGKSSHKVLKQKILCNECNQSRLLEQKRIAEEAQKKKEAEFKVRRIHSFIWPSIVSTIFLVLAIISFVDGKTSTGAIEIVLAFLGFTFFGTMILNNTFLTDLWIDVSSFGFVKMPGIMFTFDLDGLKFLIIMKIIFGLIGLAIAVLAIAFATVLTLALSIFVYPYALYKNLKGKD